MACVAQSRWFLETAKGCGSRMRFSKDPVDRFIELAALWAIVPGTMAGAVFGYYATDLGAAALCVVLGGWPDRRWCSPSWASSTVLQRTSSGHWSSPP